jgi:hypothetical protein
VGIAHPTKKLLESYDDEFQLQDQQKGNQKS